MNEMSKSSTERVQRFRQRQRDVGSKTIAMSLDRDSQHKLDQLAGGQSQARYLEALVKSAIKREWAALESRQKAERARQGVNNQPAICSGRRRSFVAGR